jgi:cytochrome c oxidase subunit 2
MLASVKVVTPAEYKEFEKTLGKCNDPDPKVCKLGPDGKLETPALWGEKLFVKNNCPTCHGAGGTGLIAGSKSPGPRLAGIYSTMQPMSTGPAVMADENYIRESILKPNAKIVQGYTTVQMPTFVMKDDQLDAVIAYVKSLK